MWGEFLKAVLTGKYKLSPVTYVGVILSLAYTIWPIDISPDVIPIIGWLDDLGLWGVVTLVFNWERGRFEADKKARAVVGNAAPASAN